MIRHIEDFRSGYELADIDMDKPVQAPRGGLARTAGLND
jgi:hypothetical protein